MFGIGMGLAVGLWSAMRSPGWRGIGAVPHPEDRPGAAVIIWFGIGEGSKFITLAFGVFFPTVIATAGGVDNVPRSLIRMAQTFGLSHYRDFRRSCCQRPCRDPEQLSGHHVDRDRAAGRCRMIGADRGIGAFVLSAGNFTIPTTCSPASSCCRCWGLRYRGLIGRLERFFLAGENGNTTRMPLSKGSVAAMLAVLLIASGFAASGARPFRRLIRAVIFRRSDRPRRRTCRRWRLRGLPYRHAAAAPYAGGRGVPTPFGTVYATNITPDLEPGIGQWSEEAFRRAMRDGIDRVGTASVSGAALSAFHPGKRPGHRRDVCVPDDPRTGHASTPPNDLPFPLDQRVPACRLEHVVSEPGSLAARIRRMMRPGTAAPIWSRLSAIAAPATRRITRWVPNDGQTLAGGEAENWYAPPLQAASPARSPGPRKRWPPTCALVSIGIMAPQRDR